MPVATGYRQGKNITYLELADGRHDVATWAKAMPAFLKSDSKLEQKY